MTIDIVPKSLYPLVPQAPGVPALLRGGAQIIDTATLGYLNVSGALNQIIGTDPVRWGVFDSNGNSIGDYDSMLTLEYANEARVSDYPVEQGSFASYNKVDNGFDVVVQLTCGGSDSRRAAFMVAAEGARHSLQTYTVLSPDFTYRNVNFTGIKIARSLNAGAYLLTIELSGKEVRNSTISQYSEPQSIGASNTIDQGLIQPVDDATIDVSGVA